MTDAETKELLMRGMDKGLELFNMGKERFMALSQKGKLIACAAASVFLLMLVFMIIPGEDYADPYKFIEHELKLDMKERADFYEKNDIVGYEILRAEKVGRMVRGAIRFIPKKGIRYYSSIGRYLKDIGTNHINGNFEWSKAMGEQCKRDVEEIEKLKILWNQCTCYFYREISFSDEGTIDVEIESRLDNGKWRPRYHRSELPERTYFVSEFSSLLTRNGAKLEAKRLEGAVAVFCDKEENIEDDKQRKFFESYAESVRRYYEILEKIDELRLAGVRGGEVKPGWEKEYAKGVKELLNILRHIPVVPEA